MSDIEVVIPAYNCRDTLPKTLGSLVAQTDPNFCVCVVDDCNEEPLEDICAMFPMLDIRLIRNENNLGSGLSRQRAIDTSDADYIIPLDSDDMLLPMAVDIFRVKARANPSVDFFVGQLINAEYNENKKKNYTLITDGLCFIASKMYKREFLERYNIRNCEEFSRFADDMYINMLSWELGESMKISMPLYFYTCNPNSVTNKDFGETYWKNIMPIFLKCIQKSTEIILNFKSINEILHLPSTLKSTKQLIKSRNIDEEKQQYRDLIKFLKEKGYNKFT